MRRDRRRASAKADMLSLGLFQRVTRAQSSRLMWLLPDLPYFSKYGVTFSSDVDLSFIGKVFTCGGEKGVKVQDKRVNGLLSIVVRDKPKG